MSCPSCHSDAHCDCCIGTAVQTPAPVANRPGLPALHYRVGTHAQFLSSMKARLAEMTVTAPGADGQTMETFRPLTGLTSRDATDPAIALLDAWATVGDVLTFYQERIANEHYLRTATERRSVLELANLVGYRPRPGVASTVYLAYTLDDKQSDPVEISAGSRAQSIPGPDEQAQAFETSETLIARREWNDLAVRRSRPQRLTPEATLVFDRLYVKGTDTQLQAGDLLLFVYDRDGQYTRQTRMLRIVDKIEADFPAQRTALHLRPTPSAVLAALPLLEQALYKLEKLGPDAGGSVLEFRAQGRRLYEANLAAAYVPPEQWPQLMKASHDNDDYSDAALDIVEELKKGIDVVLQAEPSKGSTSDPDHFVDALLKPQQQQARSSQQLSRSLRQAFQLDQYGGAADTQAQLLVNFAPELKGSYYQAWRGTQVQTAPARLQGVYALRQRCTLFGATAPKIVAYDDKTQRPKPAHLWEDWTYESDERADNAFLDQAYPKIAVGSYVIAQQPTYDAYGFAQRQVLFVKSAETAPRTAYTLSSPSTQLVFDRQWRELETGKESTAEIGALRRTQLYAESVPLQPVEEPVTDPVEGQEIELGLLYSELKSGRWVVFSGERADIEGVKGVRSAELLMVSGLRHGYDSSLPGDKTHTTLLLATPTAYRYKRDTLSIYANVAKATHGETRSEVLGSGSGGASLQSFALRQPPLTFVSAPTAAGAESSLHVYVNGVEWHEADTLAALGPRDRRFITRTADASDTTTLVFGNGEQGSRLPTGVENVKAIYRSGIGKAGNVRAEQISMLMTRQQGVNAVINPLRASGGADKEARDLVRDNAPLSVLALDRLVSVSDYADFTRMFAGIAKACAARLSVGGRELVHITIAGVDDAPIDPVSDLYRNLLAALRELGDPGLSLQLASRELIALVLSARIKILPGYRWETVESGVRAALLDAFGFHRRRLAQPALLCEVLGVIQAQRGVDYVDVDTFGGVPEKTANDDGSRRLLHQHEIRHAIQYMLDPGEYGASTGLLTSADEEVPAQRVRAAAAALDHGALRPAQLAIFTPGVPDTLILNPIP